MSSIVFLYILYYTALKKPQSRTNIIYSINLDVFNQLYFEHNDTLSCPCSRSVTLYRDFVSYNATFHSVCHSIFVSDTWIEALYFPNASRYAVADFRTTANAQFRLLADLCSFSQDAILQNQHDLDNNELVTLYLLHQSQVHSEVNAMIDLFESTLTSRINSFLSYLRITTRANYLVSALNTNFLILYQKEVDIKVGGAVTFGSWSITGKDDSAYAPCSTENPTSATSFISLSWEPAFFDHARWEEPPAYLSPINGFFAACTPFEAILKSTLNCLYDATCIQLLSDHFPRLSRTNISVKNSVLLGSKNTNISVHDLLLNLFVQDRRTSITYSTYFQQCSPSFCTYTTTDESNISYTITLFVSLYGGLVLIFRFIASFSIKILFKLKYHTQVSETRNHASQFVRWMKRLNLFKKLDDRSDESVKQQRLMTRVYLALLMGTLHFSLLSSLCQFANQTVSDVIRRFLAGSFITSNVLTEVDFQKQINTILTEFILSAVTYFDLFVETTDLLLQVDQPFIGSLYNTYVKGDATLLFTPLELEVNGSRTAQLILQMFGTRDIYTGTINCICATDPSCRNAMAIYNDELDDYTADPVRVNYIVPGFRAGCFALKSLRLSTLECLYSNSECFSILMDYIHEIYTFNVEDPVWFDARPLVFNSTSSKFSQKIEISKIISEIMVEKWNPSISYKLFYESCAPSHCSYSEKVHTKTASTIVITLISVIGGASVLLHLLTPYLVKFLIRIFTKRKRRPQQQARRELFKYLKIIIQEQTVRLYNTAVDLNIFPVRRFGNNVSYAIAKRLGQWATRLFLLLLVVVLVITALYTLIQPQALTKTFDKPSFDYYTQLKQKYEDSLKCPCSSVASIYNQFLSIDLDFHQLCSSEFILDEWRSNLTTGLAANLFIYSQRDYRRFLSAHLQFLQGLCQLSMKSANSLVQQFLSSLFITTQLLSETDFNIRVSSLINQTKSNAPISLNRLLSSTRIVNHGNIIISTYGTNFEYIQDKEYSSTQAVTYDDGCSCDLSPNCTTQANFIELNVPRKVSIIGMKMGCTPSDSFRLSTLECFFDQVCLDHVQYYTHYSQRIVPLNLTMKRFSVESTVNELISQAFVEEWTTAVSYISYFNKCSPLSCSHTYVKRFDFFYTIIVLIGLQGGLTIVLKWICPQIVRLLHKIFQHRKNLITPVRSVHTVEMTPGESINLDPPIRRLADEVFEVDAKSRLKILSKCSIICVILVLVVIIVVTYSVFINRCERSQETPIVVSINFTIIYSSTAETITTSTANTSLTHCQPTFELISVQTSDDNPAYFYPVAGDFNGDNQLDIVYYSPVLDSIGVILGIGNGSFEAVVKLTPLYGASIVEMAVGDFNKDNYLDIVTIVNEYDSYLLMLVGQGDGIFEASTSFPQRMFYYARDVVVSDVNSDNQPDIVVVSSYGQYIVLFLGINNEMFTEYHGLSAGFSISARSVVVNEFNNDNHLDIAVLDEYSRNIIVFLGRGNSTFEERIVSFTGGALVPAYITVGNFNADNRSDIVVSYETRCSIGVMFGYGNGSFGNIIKFYTAASRTDSRAVVIDFNGDDHSDIIFYRYDPSSIDILLGNGRGRFERKTILPVEIPYDISRLIAGDFNGDGYQDIINLVAYSSPFNVLLNTCECCTT
ncbi:unnamed protein product [Adineta ricciae]|uniref:Uncharacterized protein n=1 Tax=Adineta ricciae TaxID=249248 RepID=A0A815RIN5_ADIRI|nr:unnamed protein product [Adineta ricciae]